MNQAQEDSSPHVSDAGGLSVERLAFKSGSTLPSEGLFFNWVFLGVGPGAHPFFPCSEGLGGGGWALFSSHSVFLSQPQCLIVGSSWLEARWSL